MENSVTYPFCWSWCQRSHRPRCPWISQPNWHIEVVGCQKREELRSKCCHTTRGGSPTQVNSVTVNTSIRFDGATQPTGDQRWEQSELVSVDGDIDRQRAMCVSSARVKIWVARRASGRSVSPRAASSKEKEGSQFARDSSGQ